MSMALRVSGLINAIGEVVTYKRKTGSTSLNTTTLQRTTTYTDYTLKVSIRGYSLKEIGAGLVDAGDREVRIAAKDLSFTPSRLDKIVISGREFTVKSVNTRTAFNENAVHVLMVGGDNV